MDKDAKIYVAGHGGAIAINPFRSDGTPQEFLDMSGINILGRKAKAGLWDGVKKTYGCFVERI